MTLGSLVMAFFLSSADMTVLLAPDAACSACSSHPAVTWPVVDALACSWLLPSQPGVPSAALLQLRGVWAGSVQTRLQEHGAFRQEAAAMYTAHGLVLYAWVGRKRP